MTYDSYSALYHGYLFSDSTISQFLLNSYLLSKNSVSARMGQAQNLLQITPSFVIPHLMRNLMGES